MSHITSFFASVDLSRVETLLYQRLGKTASTGLLCDVVQQHDALTTRSGIPQRSYVSAAIANMFLRPIDDVLQSFVARSSGKASVSRWMDDLNAMGKDDDLYSLHLELEDRARQIGLELNSSKSVLCPAAQLQASLAAEGLTEFTFTKTGARKVRAGRRG